ncbi:hypothetical protein GCM10010302_66170 [Streptomyces polychromogenes]|uniref:Uncharacterized protein n=1 Tax=Streptomyces polychromogenes TaxID=67342 RepID=A0ABP3FJ01_9ACTN
MPGELAETVRRTAARGREERSRSVSATAEPGRRHSARTGSGCRALRREIPDGRFDGVDLGPAARGRRRAELPKAEGALTARLTWRDHAVRDPVTVLQTAGPGKYSYQSDGKSGDRAPPQPPFTAHASRRPAGTTRQRPGAADMTTTVPAERALRPTPAPRCGARARR